MPTSSITKDFLVKDPEAYMELLQEIEDAAKQKESHKMKYKIEIWQWQSMRDIFESDNIEDIVEWYESEWKDCFEMGYCSFGVYENDRRLSFDEEWDLGFHKL